MRSRRTSHAGRGLLAWTLAVSCVAGAIDGARAQDPDSPGLLEPVLTTLMGHEVRVPNTDQASGSTLLNLVGPLTEQDAIGATSLLGHVITSMTSPNDDMALALASLSGAAQANDVPAMQAAAEHLMNILLGTTQGRIYDGFAMLNYNRGAFLPDQVPGEYKMKTLRDTGLTAPGMDGVERKIWEVDVAFLWYDGQFDSDTFLMRVPVEANEFDTVRVNYTIYSLEREDFAPTTVMLDYRAPGSVQFPFKGEDSVWAPVQNDRVTRMTVALPPVRLIRGVYTWGWRVHPPRIQFLQPVYEMVNAHTGEVELEPQGRSFAERNRALTIADIGDAAPEKKMYEVATAVLNGAGAADVDAMLNDPNTSPRGTWQQWADLAKNQRQLPPEALDVLAGEGISPGSFGPYRMVSVYMNNEMYGDGPEADHIAGWHQGDRFTVKLINLDNHTHYFRNVDFGARLNDDLANGGFPAASHSFEMMNFKPTYGAPKVAEVQWRAGWGFRPHLDVIQQSEVFSRQSDRALLSTFFDGAGAQHTGWQYSADLRDGDFRFNPPPFIIGSTESPSAFPLREFDGSPGLLIGRHTEGYGIAKMCSHVDHPLGGFCQTDISAYNPHGVKNIDTDSDGTPDVLWFPPFLRNPDPNAGGDIIPPTPAWKPFLWINPNNGTLQIDPSDPSQGYWADLTYSHGAPVYAGSSLDANIEAPRAAAQVFYQFDDLFHDNAIFSPHPTFAPTTACTADLNGDGRTDVLDFGLLASGFENTGVGRIGGDVNRDGIVDVFDFGSMAADFGCVAN